MHSPFQNKKEYSLPQIIHFPIVIFILSKHLVQRKNGFKKKTSSVINQPIPSVNSRSLLISFYYRTIKAYKTSEFHINLTDWSNSCNEPINYLEHVEVSVNLTYTLRGELLIKLISPQGTVSNLTHYRKADAAFGAKDLNWVLMTLHHWGENANGLWKLTLESSHPYHNNEGYYML